MRDPNPGMTGRTTGRFAILAALAAALLAATLLMLSVPALAQEEAPADKGSTETYKGRDIVGGNPVPVGAFPFMTSIQADTSGANGYNEHFCGGTLIDSDSVLTAAHCVDFIGRLNTPTTLAFRDVKLVVGVTRLDTNQGQARRIAAFSDIRIHPNYNPRSDSRFDAAVINLASPVSNIQPMVLTKPANNGLERPGTTAVIAGWGNTKAQPISGGGSFNAPRQMQVAYPPIVSDYRAERAYTSSYFGSLMIAAGKQGVDTCQGDSGGPLWVTTDAGRRQVGITSFGAGCAQKDFPGVYTETNASGIYNFIRNAASQ